MSVWIQLFTKTDDALSMTHYKSIANLYPVCWSYKHSVTDPQVYGGVMAGALSIDEAEGLHQTGLLAVQEQGPPYGLPLVLLHTVQLNLNHETFKTHT